MSENDVDNPHSRY